MNRMWQYNQWISQSFWAGYNQHMLPVRSSRLRTEICSINCIISWCKIPSAAIAKLKWIWPCGCFPRGGDAGSATPRRRQLPTVFVWIGSTAGLFFFREPYIWIASPPPPASNVNELTETLAWCTDLRAAWTLPTCCDWSTSKRFATFWC